MDDDWKIYRFSLDDIQEKPKSCQQEVLRFLGRWYGGRELRKRRHTTPVQQIIRIAVFTVEPLTPKDVSERIGISNRYARTLLRSLCDEEILEAASAGKKRIRSYRLNKKKPISLDILGD